MVNVTIAGGTGSVAREVIHALAASGNHEITIFTRKTPSPDLAFAKDLSWKVVDYNNLKSLVVSLRGTHTLLSFIQLLLPDGVQAQKNLIDAAVQAGVKRFAPSEWASKDLTDMPFYRHKQLHRDHLASLPRSVNMEWTLFQPGLFLEYLAYPHKTAQHLDPMMTVFDFANCRALVVDGMEAQGFITFTSVKDLARAVVGMVELPHGGDEGAVAWPRVSGIRGNRLCAREVIAMGERITGRKWDVTTLEQVDLEAGELKSTWGLTAVHRAVPSEAAARMLKQVAVGMLLSLNKGAWDCSDEVNFLLFESGFECAKAEEFLEGVWGAKRK